MSPRRGTRGTRGTLAGVGGPLAVAALLAAGCGDALAPLPAEGPPRELVYANGGFVASLVRVELAGDTVVYARTGIGPADVAVVTRRVPSADEWRAFWRAVDEAGVRRWPRSCPSDVVYDGPGFEFALAWAGGRRSGGYGLARPAATGRCSADGSEATERFQRAVLRVAGDVPPGGAP